MKTLKITAENAQAIEDALREANGRAAEHTYTTYEEIEKIAARAERLLGGYISAVARYAGARYKSTSGGSVPNAYKFTRTATAVTLERRKAGWYLTEIRPTKIYKKGGNEALLLTPEQDAEAVVNLRKGYQVR
jgi:hypothetical protein